MENDLRPNDCKLYCDMHITQVANMSEVKARLDSIEQKIDSNFEVMKQHIEQGEKWRLAIIGIIFAGIVQVVTFAYFWGALNSQVKINTERWNRVIEKGGFK